MRTEIICAEKKQAQKKRVKKLLRDTGAFPYKNTGTFPQLIGTMRCVPDLSALDDIGDIVVLAPDVLEFMFQRKIIFRDQLIPSTQLAMIYRIAHYLIIKIEHSGSLDIKLPTLHKLSNVPRKYYQEMRVSLVIFSRAN